MVGWISGGVGHINVSSRWAINNSERGASLALAQVACQPVSQASQMAGPRSLMAIVEITTCAVSARPSLT